MGKNNKQQNCRRLRLTSERINCYGTWLVTAGGDIEQYSRNPVLLYMHRRGEVIGYLSDIRVENDEITAEPVFDDVTEISRQVHQQYDMGSLRMASVGFNVIETSEDPSLLKQGQTYATITKWKLREVSIVDIGANDDAIRLYDKDGVEMSLSSDGKNPLPKLNINNQNPKRMELKEIALMLGLPETATEAEVREKITKLSAAAETLKAVQMEKDALVLSAITDAVDTAIVEKRLAADKKDKFIALGQKIGLDDLKETLSAMTPAVKVSDVLSGSTSAPAGGSEYKKLSDVPADKLADLRKNDAATYKKLYRAEYGIDCEL